MEYVYQKYVYFTSHMGDLAIKYLTLILYN